MADDYEPLIGDTISEMLPHPLRYITIDNKTAKSVNIKAASYRQSNIYFSTKDLVVDETWGIVTGIDAFDALKWETNDAEDWVALDDESWLEPYANHPQLWDIKEVEPIIVNDIIVGYYALMEVRIRKDV